MASPKFSVAQSEAFPKMIKVVVPVVPGASNDIFAREMSKQMSERLGITIIVENRPGGGSVIGSEYVSRAQPDGSTLLFNSVTFSTVAAVSRKLPYDPVKSFETVAVFARGPMVLVVRNDSTIKSLQQLIDAARPQNTRITFGSAGPGSIAHLGGELFNTLGGTHMRHIPYKGAAAAVLDVLAGHIDMTITTLPSVNSLLQKGSLRVLATTTATPSKWVPGSPTAMSLVPGFEVEAWWGVFAPAGTPRPVINALNQAIREAGRIPALAEKLAMEGAEPSDLSSTQAQEYVAREVAKWKRLAQQRNIVLD